MSMFKAVVLGVAHPHILAVTKVALGMADAEVVGVWDADEGRREKAAEQLGIASLGSLEEALGLGASLALIGAVPNDRAGLAVRALASGASALMDKPIAVRQEGLDELKAGVARYGRPAMVYYPYRGKAEIQAARRFVGEGGIGRLVRVFASAPHKLNASGRPDWHWKRETNGGALIDIGCHSVDVACWFADQSPEWLCAAQGNYGQPGHPEFQDYGQIMMRFPGGEMGLVEVDWLNPASMASFGDVRLHFAGTEGKVEIRMGDYAEARYWTHEEAARELPIPEGLVHGEAWTAALMRELAAGGCELIGQDDVWRTSQITLQAFESANGGGVPVEVGSVSRG